MDLTKCSIDSIHAYSIEVFNPEAQKEFCRVSAKIGYGVGGRAVGESIVSGLEKHEEVQEAARVLIEAIEKAFAPTIGVLADDKKLEGELPSGLVNI